MEENQSSSSHVNVILDFVLGLKNKRVSWKVHKTVVICHPIIRVLVGPLLEMV